MKTLADRLTPDEHDLFLDAYELGYGDGLDRGKVLAEAEMAAAWATVAAAVRRTADVPPFAEIQRRRGVAA